MEDPSFRLGQGAECFHLPLQRVLKSKYPQHWARRHHHMSFLPCSRLERGAWSYLFTPTQAPVHHLSLGGCGTSTQSQTSFLAAISFSPHLPGSTCFLFSDICSKCVSLALSCKLRVTMGTVPDPAGSLCALLIKLWLSPQLDL